MKIIEQLKNHSAGSKLALMIRHGDRDMFPEGELGNDVLLNRKGIENSLLLGELLRDFEINRILTSPVQRCVQTADCIVKGYGKELEIIQTPCLGDPGLHITDDSLAAEYFLKHGFFKILDEFINGVPSPGLRKKDEYQRLMTDFICSETKEGGLTLYVTHDSLIALYHYCIFNTTYTPDNWVEYLGGLIVDTNGNGK